MNRPPVTPWYTILRARGLSAARAFILAARLRRISNSRNWPPEVLARVLADAQQLTPVGVERQTAALKP